MRSNGRASKPEELGTLPTFLKSLSGFKFQPSGFFDQIFPWFFTHYAYFHYRCFGDQGFSTGILQC
jgi:hypothetical protein